jgi:hypothetical protein
MREIEIMTIRRLPALSAAMLTLSMQPGYAGPCSSQIDRVQAAVDAKIEATAAAGRSAPESTSALLNHQPTPDSIAAAERKLGEGSRVQAALGALARARDADLADDRSACERALADAQRALSP